MSMLCEASIKLASTVELHEIYAIMKEFISGVMECCGLTVSSFGAETEMLECKYYLTDEGPADVSKLPRIPLLPEGHGTQSIVIRTRKSMIINDFVEMFKRMKTTYHADDSDSVHEKIPEDAPHTRSAIIVPLKHAGKVIGAINVQSYRKGAYSESDLRLLESLATHAEAPISIAEYYANAASQIAGRREAESIARICWRLMDEACLGVMLVRESKSNGGLEIVDASELAAASFGMSRQGLRGQTIRGLLGDEAHATLREAVDDALTSGGTRATQPKDTGAIYRVIRTDEDVAAVIVAGAVR